MHLSTNSASTIDYGRKLFDSGVEGARAAQQEFMHGEPLAPFLGESLRDAWKPAVLGACLGLLSSIPTRRSAARAVACGLIGGAIGFSAGVAWKSRRLSASVVSGAVKNIRKVRNEHWLETHPIDYA